MRDERYVFGGITFEWNADKAASNIRKHQVRFAEGATVFADEEALMIADPDHSDEEPRFILVGLSRIGRILVVVCVERGDRFRIISVREAQRKEQTNMKKADSDDPDEMRQEYDFAQGVKNPYARRFAKGSNVVLIRPEIFVAFPSEEAVNQALDGLIRDGEVTKSV